MVILNEKESMELINSKTFKTNVHQLANRLKISDEDAQQELYWRVTQKRLKNMSEEEFNRKWNDESERKIINWKITYARQDIQHLYYKNCNKEEERTARLKYTVPTLDEVRKRNEPTVMEHIDDKTQQLIDLLLDNIRKIFPKSKVKVANIYDVIMHRKELSNKELNWLLSDIRRSCRNKTKTIDDIFNSVSNEENMKQLRIINAILETEQSDMCIADKDRQIQILINANEDVVDELINECMDKHRNKIKHPVVLLRQWSKAETSEQNILLDYLESKSNELKAVIDWHE